MTSSNATSVNLFGEKISKSEPEVIPKRGTLVFKFLDTWRKGNRAGCLRLLHEVTEREPAELVLGLLARHLRDLYWVRLGGSGLDYPDWRMGKLKRQASGFSESELVNVIGRLAEIDAAAKSGEAELTSSLDLLIIESLE